MGCLLWWFRTKIYRFYNGTALCLLTHVGLVSHIDGLMKDCSISSALAMEILQSYTKLLIYASWQTDLIFFEIYSCLANPFISLIASVPGHDELIMKYNQVLLPECISHLFFLHQLYKFVLLFVTIISYNHLLPQVRISVVEIRRTFIKLVKIELLPSIIPGPGRTTVTTQL